MVEDQKEFYKLQRKAQAAANRVLRLLRTCSAGYDAG